MFRWTILLALGTLLFSVSAASAQICPLNGTSSNKLVCLIPQVYGPFGLGGGGSEPNDKSVLFTGDHHAAHFESDFLSTFAPDQ